MLEAALGMPGPTSCRHSLGLPSVALPSTGKEMSIDELYEPVSESEASGGTCCGAVPAVPGTGAVLVVEGSGVVGCANSAGLCTVRGLVGSRMPSQDDAGSAGLLCLHAGWLRPQGSPLGSFRAHACRYLHCALRQVPLFHRMQKVRSPC